MSPHFSKWQVPSARFSAQNSWSHPGFLSLSLIPYLQAISKPCQFYFVTYLESVRFKIITYCWKGWVGG